MIIKNIMELHGDGWYDAEISEDQFELDGELIDTMLVADKYDNWYMINYKVECGTVVNMYEVDEY